MSVERAAGEAELANVWASRLVAPAFVFWAAGLFAWIWGHDRTHVVGQVSSFLTHSNPTAPLAVTVGALAIIAVSGVIAHPLALPVLRALEGYWLKPFTPLADLLAARQRSTIARRRRRWLQLAERGLTSLTPNELNEYARLDQWLQRVPEDESLVMPLRLGNILRAAESRPQDRYGLDSIVCWPRLWLLLPEAVKDELTAARSKLDGGALVVFWSLASVLWGALWLSWLIPAALLAAILTYFWMLDQAQVYADLLEATYDVHRRLLYTALGYTMPQDLETERRLGEQVTLFLWRGEQICLSEGREPSSP